MCSTTGLASTLACRAFSCVRILLDGQQRITTLYMLMLGKIPPYYTAAEILNDTRGL